MNQKNSKKSENNNTEIVDVDYQIEQGTNDNTTSSNDQISVSDKHSKVNSSEQVLKDQILDEVQELYQKLEEKDNQYNKVYDRYLRALADYENLEKRTKIERAGLVNRANEQLLLKLLDLAETFEKAEANIITENSVNNDLVLDGFKAVQKQFLTILKNEGVERIQAVGKKFDPNFHEAVFVKENSEVEEDTILEEVQAGYLLNSSLLRPTKVVIAKSQLKGEK
ncbi:MAG: nucleotide exchange factor GrpE [Candidatus Hodarchaeota archaeon]